MSLRNATAVLFCLIGGGLAITGAELTAKNAHYGIDDRTGKITAIGRDNFAVVNGIENHYFVRRVSGDAEAWEKADQKCGVSAGWTIYTNPQLPQLRIAKKYWTQGEYLRRSIRFENLGRDTAFVTMRTRTRFTPDFYQNGFYLGSGFIGPLIPVPKISAPQQVSQYKQSTKGMVLYHDRGQAGSFAHYRLTLDGKFVFPWWQSAISNYIEPENNLYYHPDGWEMSLGTVDVKPGKTFEITDTFIAFSGSWFRFMDEIYSQDPVVAPQLKQLKPGPAWLQQVSGYTGIKNFRDVQQIASAMPQGTFMVLTDILGGWGDYRVWHSANYPGQMGGVISAQEHRAYLEKIKQVSPKLKVGSYMFLNSTMATAPIVAEHPEYLMLKDRAGRAKNLFPGDFVHNYPTMVNRPAVRHYLINDIMRQFIANMPVDYIYLDETKTTNLIDWQRNDCVRDDHWNKFWQDMYVLGKEQNKVMFGNGRGNPYHELNFIEARAQLNPRYWRHFAGMALAVAALEKHRAGARVCLLYWHDNVDYINRVLANGFVPALLPFRPRQISFVRAVAETGALNTAELRYSPDWKSDPETGLESYASTRLAGGETLLSLIQREKDVIPEIKVDLSKHPKQLSIWGYQIAHYQDRLNDKYCVSDADLRQVYRQCGWREGIVAEPELLYCGANPGVWTQAQPKLVLDRMTMLVIGHPLAGVYSVNALPQNFFYCETPEVRIVNSAWPLEVESQAKEAEIIMFQPGRRYTVNGQAAKTRYAEFGGKYFTVIQVPQGRSVIADAGAVAAPQNLTRVWRDGILRSCETSFKLPKYHAGGLLTIAAPGQAVREQKSVPGARTATMRVPMPVRKPNQSKFEPMQKKLDGALIKDAAKFTSSWRNVTGVQEKLAPLIAEFEVSKLELKAGTSRRIMDYLGNSAAGFHLMGADQVELQLDHTFDFNSGILRTHVNRHRRKPIEFAGLMVDYRTSKGWVRVAFVMDNVLHSRPKPGVHPWGAKKPAQRILRGADGYLKQPGRHNFTFSLRRYAPRDWTGEAWLTAATGFVKPGRYLQFTLRHANAACQAPELMFRDQSAEAQWMKLPRQLKVPRLSGKIDFSRVWQEGQGASGFAKIRFSGRSEYPTEFKVAHDGKNLYAAMRLAPDKEAENIVEMWIYAKEAKRYRQIVALPSGDKFCYKGVLPDGGESVNIWRNATGNEILFTVPASYLGQALRGKWRFNLCRSRMSTLKDAAEYSTWSPLSKGYNDVKNFGEITFEE